MYNIVATIGPIKFTFDRINEHTPNNTNQDNVVYSFITHKFNTYCCTEGRTVCEQCVFAPNCTCSDSLSLQIINAHLPYLRTEYPEYFI